MFRVIDLPCEVGLSKANGAFNDGTLEVVMTKADSAKSIRVETKPELSAKADASVLKIGRIEAAGNPPVVTGANEPMVKEEAASSKG